MWGASERGFRNRGLIGRYLLMSLLVALCCFLRLQVPWHTFSYFLFVPAVVLGAMLFGRGAALYATMLAVPIALFFFVEPVYTLRMAPDQVPPLALYLLVCGSLAMACEWPRRVLTARAARQALSTATGPVAVSHDQAGRRTRLGGIDFWRGFALCTIFINHMPGNVFENVTFRNFGFSDAAEAFIYLFGVALALAYGPRLARGDRTGVLSALAQRAIKLYGVHIALSLAGIAIFTAGAIAWHAPGLLSVHGRDLFVADAELFLAGVFSLGHQLGYFNILPLYIVLVFWAPVWLWLSHIDRRLLLTLSALLYAASRCGGWNLPSWPVEGTWFLNPFAWQLLMAIGITAGPMLKEGSLPVSRRWFRASALILVAGAFITTDGLGLSPGLQAVLSGPLDLDKNNLGLGRLVHFLALGYCVYCSGMTSWLRQSPIFEPLAVLGRNSLLVFAMLSLLDAVGQVLIETIRNTVWLDAGLILGGLMVLYSVARLADAVTNVDRSRTKPVRPTALVNGDGRRT